MRGAEASVSVVGCTFVGNRVSQGVGGAISISHSGRVAGVAHSIADSLFINQTVMGGRGGGVGVTFFQSVEVDSLFANPSVPPSPRSGSYTATELPISLPPSQVHVTRCTFLGGRAPAGGAVYVSYVKTLLLSKFRNLSHVLSFETECQLFQRWRCVSFSVARALFLSCFTFSCVDLLFGSR